MDKTDSDAKSKLEEFIYHSEDLERLETLLRRFNAFQALKLVNNETRHSNFLAWLLNPNDSHGVGDTFLKLFLKELVRQNGVTMPSLIDIDTWHFESSLVLREWKHIDVLIVSEENRFTCLIENKVWSKEHGDQLARYKEIVETDYLEFTHIFIYLTVDGEEPSTDGYLTLDHTSVVAMLERFLLSRQMQMQDDVASFIRQYIETVRRFIVQDSEVQELCHRIYQNHKDAIDLILEYRPDLQSDVRDVLVEAINEDDELELDKWSKTLIRFIPQSLDFLPRICKGWTVSKRIVLFEIKNLENKISIYLYVGPGPSSIRTELLEIAQNHSVFDPQKRIPSEGWFYLYKKRDWIKASTLENLSREELKAEIKSKLDKFKADTLPGMTAALSSSGTLTDFNSK
ncbi:PDDEXK-like family protein [Alicyclobacillus sp. ALC3]|uniref:PDDEXK-like family protein n=1 Tax=Alicyclobacillus sp. ALC3 TaxID=2796143 RepID=UPI00237834E6|nr:PD-(D/E)XK nuclease family protein [Alicyclobacillus sp. ALC3]WDL97893.1 PD-(D/E)XK nuclease family protein [Alicyclobacillus sp. ALC3]